MLLCYLWVKYLVVLFSDIFFCFLCCLRSFFCVFACFVVILFCVLFCRIRFKVIFRRSVVFFLFLWVVISLSCFLSILERLFGVFDFYVYFCICYEE